MEQLDYNLLFRWFVGLAMDAPVWDVTVFTKNRDRLLAGDVAVKFLAAVLSQPRVRGCPVEGVANFHLISIEFGQSAEQDSAHRHIDECLISFRKTFVINDQTAVGEQPCKESLNQVLVQRGQRGRTEA